MNQLILFNLIFWLSYALLLFWALQGLAALPRTPPSQNELTLPPTVVLVAHYDHAKSLPALFAALSSQVGLAPKSFRIILVDDHSAVAQKERARALCAEQPFAVCFWENQNPPGKKNALRYALERIDEEYIIQTDADCVPAPDFVKNMATTLLESEAPAVLGRVEMRSGNSFWSRFAALEFCSLQAIGLGLAQRLEAIMANGAALAFRRTMWLKHSKMGAQFASGDDTFFVQSLVSRGLKPLVNHRASVQTETPQNLDAFLQQRLRWGGKAVAYRSRLAQGAALSVAGLNSMLLVNLLVAITFGGWYWLLCLSFWLAKAALDYRILQRYLKLSLQKWPAPFAVSAVLYPFYIVAVLMAMLWPGTGKWRGRRYA